MAKSSVKQQGVHQAAIAFDGGLNLADNPDALPDNQLADVVNMFYEEAKTVLTTRPGLVHAAEPPPGGGAVVALHWFERDALAGMLIAATSDGKLYRLDQPAGWVHLAISPSPA